VADLYRAQLRRVGMSGARLLVESFILLDPHHVLRAGLVPYWSFFPVSRAAWQLRDYLESAGPYDEIDVLLFSNGVRSQGQAGPDVWRSLAQQARRRGRLLAVDERRFPADFGTFGRYGPALRRIPTAPGRVALAPAEALAHLMAQPGVATRSTKP
jgi:hypothetical protein